MIGLTGWRCGKQRKERTFPELMGHNRSTLGVLGVEVGGRWSQETQQFVSLLARAKARGETNLLRRRAEQVWRLRWGSILAGADGDTPASQDVEQDGRFVGLAR